MLADDLKILLATTTSFYLKTHGFHWNVTGPNFPQYHALFESIYTDAYGAVDPLAEYIRTLQEFAPASFSRYTELTLVKDQTKIPKAELMIKELIKDSETIIALLDKIFDTATVDKQNGIANFVADRQTMHGKWLWQLRATVE